MLEKRRQHDRRGEVRGVRAGQIRWRRAGTCTTFRGWLSDASPASVSFIAPDRSRPASGEEIEVFGADRGQRRYRVARIAPYDERLSLVACRRVSRHAVEWDVPPSTEA